MKTFGEFLTEEEKEISKKDLDAIEAYADKLFKSLSIDINFTKHFLERTNDPRNKKQITVSELVRLWRQTHKKYGKKIQQMGGSQKDAEAVIADMQTDINVPFILKLDYKNREIDLVSKTIMRKKNFHSPDQKLAV